MEEGIFCIIVWVFVSWFPQIVFFSVMQFLSLSWRITFNVDISFILYAVDRNSLFAYQHVTSMIFAFPCRCLFGYELNLIVFYPLSVWTLYWLLLYSVSDSKTDLLCNIIKNDFYVKSSLNVRNFIPYMVIWLKLQKSYPDWQGWFFVLGVFCKYYLATIYVCIKGNNSLT